MLEGKSCINTEEFGHKRRVRTSSPDSVILRKRIYIVERFQLQAVVVKLRDRMVIQNVADSIEINEVDRKQARKCGA